MSGPTAKRSSFTGWGTRFDLFGFHVGFVHPGDSKELAIQSMQAFMDRVFPRQKVQPRMVSRVRVSRLRPRGGRKGK